MDLSDVHYDDQGLVPAIAQDADTGDVLMLAYMNAESLRRTLETGAMTYWSRSRQEFWVKGMSSGNKQKVVEFRMDCDGDTLLFKVQQTGAACHTGYRSCFYRKASSESWETDTERVFIPADGHE